MYRDPTLNALIVKLNAEGPAKLKNRYYIGDPMVVAESQLPICFVTKDTTTINAETNAEDRMATAVVLNVVNKFATELNQQAFVQAGTSGLYELCEARNDDYSLKEGSIAYVLRKYETIDGDNKLYIDVDSDLVIDYNISPPSRRGIFSTEALIRTTIFTHRLSPVDV